MLHVMSAQCVAHDLHTIAPGPLEHTCWRQFAPQWEDCKKILICAFERNYYYNIITELLFLVFFHPHQSCVINCLQIKTNIASIAPQKIITHATLQPTWWHPLPKLQQASAAEEDCLPDLPAFPQNQPDVPCALCTYKHHYPVLPHTSVIKSLSW